MTAGKLLYILYTNGGEKTMGKMDKQYPRTLREIEALEEEVLCPQHIVKFLGSNENTINCSAEAGKLPWAYKLGSRTVIPKEAFIHWHKYGAVLRNNNKLTGDA
jgi:hypothetical protein